MEARRAAIVSGGLMLMLAALPIAGCHSSDAASDDAGIPADADFVTCVGETRAPPFQQGMQVTSTGGGMVLKVLKSTFTDASGQVLTEDPAKGVDVWTIETDDVATSTPVEGLSIAVRPYMPDHGHGTTAVGVMPAGAGTYTIAPLNLYMAGYWEITFNLTGPSASADAAVDPDASASAAPMTDSAVVKICVPD